MLVQNEMGEFVDNSGPSSEERRRVVYANLQAIKPKDVRPMVPQPRERPNGAAHDGTCARCGKEFHAKRARKYCSDACREAEWTERRKRRNLAKAYGRGL